MILGRPSDIHSTLLDYGINSATLKGSYNKNIETYSEESNIQTIVKICDSIAKGLSNMEMQIHKSDPYFLVSGESFHIQTIIAAIPLLLIILGCLLSIFVEFFNSKIEYKSIHYTISFFIHHQIIGFIHLLLPFTIEMIYHLYDQKGTFFIQHYTDYHERSLHKMLYLFFIGLIIDYNMVIEIFYPISCGMIDYFQKKNNYIMMKPLDFNTQIDKKILKGLTILYHCAISIILIFKNFALAYINAGCVLILLIQANSWKANSLKKNLLILGAFLIFFLFLNYIFYSAGFSFAKMIISMIIKYRTIGDIFYFYLVSILCPAITLSVYMMVY